ncbi:MAG TPA: DUF2141 domain-containing protein [Rhizomicrobium sp.]|nr:DUF2141 domain-containing protein [Rhizomicrobium sp.]
MKRYVWLLLLAVAPGAAHADELAHLTVVVRNVSDAGGDLRLGIYDAENFAKKGGIPVARKSVHARGGTMTLEFDGIPPGTYAVKVAQDINMNGTFDYGMKGIEPFGFSRDPAVTVGLPPFDDAKIALAPGANAIDIHLR